MIDKSIIDKLETIHAKLDNRLDDIEEIMDELKEQNKVSEDVENFLMELIDNETAPMEIRDKAGALYRKV